MRGQKGNYAIVKIIIIIMNKFPETLENYFLLVYAEWSQKWGKK